MPNEKLQRTPLHRCHLQLGAKMVPFAGFEMPVQYVSVLEEAKTVRKACGLFDVSHMGQFSVRGKASLLEIQKLVTNDLEKLGVGQAQYNTLCKDDGGTLDDLVVYRRAEEHTFICVNASNIRKDFDWIRFHLPSNMTLEDESEATALLALQGPRAEEILTQIGHPSVIKGLKYYWAAETKVLDYPCYLSRTGYTGEDGYELYVNSSHAIDVWERLIEIGRKLGLMACGLGARDTLRLEMGYPLYGHELNEATSPLACGLSWVVKLQRENPFIGQAALQREASSGPSRMLKGIMINDRRLARQGYRIADIHGALVGEITSGTFSPHLNAPIALGFVKPEAASEENYQIEIRETYVPAKSVKLPFVQPRTKRELKTP